MTQTRSSARRERPCQAVDPSTCRFHVHPPKTASTTAESMFREYMAEHREKAVPASEAGTRVDHAKYASLNWTGPKPAWWEDYAAAAESNPRLPVKPELLDVIDSPEGPLAVVWQPNSHEEQDKSVTLDSGMDLSVCYYKSVETGETLGYVKMTSMSDESIKRSFGDDEFTPWRFRERFGGSQYGFTDWEDENPDKIRYGKRNLKGAELDEFRRSLWLRIQKNLSQNLTQSDGSYVAYYNMNESHIPDDDTVRKDIKASTKQIAKGFKNERAYYETPYVDYSRVEEPLKGKGFGAALYVYTARRLAKDGQVLRGSGIQSDDAQGLWGKFKKKFPKNVSTKTLDYHGNKEDFHILDFRA